MKNPLSIFAAAFRGIWVFVKTERNAKFHLLAALLVVLAGFYFDLDTNSWLWISLAFALVFITEMLNTALEKVCNKIEPERNPVIRDIKDIAAGAVLVSALFALVVAFCIFAPLLLEKVH